MSGYAPFVQFFFQRGFRGILTTDDLWYDQVIKRFSPVDVAVKAMQAGHDIILKAKDITATVERLTAAALAAKLTAAFPGVQNYTLRPDMDPAYYEKILATISTADLVVLSLFVQRNRLGDAAPLSKGICFCARRAIPERWVQD